MSRLFVIVLIVGLVLSVLIPAYLPFVVVGALVGLLPLAVRWVRGVLARRRAAKAQTETMAAPASVFTLGRVAGGLGLAAAALVAGSGFFGADTLQMRELPPVEVAATWNGTATVTQDPDRVRLEQKVTILRDDIDKAAKQAIVFDPPAPGTDPETAAAELARAITAGLDESMPADGWSAGDDTTTARVTFVKSDDSDVKTRWYRLEETNVIDVPTVRLSAVAAVGSDLVLRFAEGSELEVIADRYMIGRTYPKGEAAAELAQPVDHVTIPAPIPQPEFQLNARPAWARNVVMSPIADVTTAGVVLWLYAILLALASDPIKAWVKGLVARLRGKTPTADAGPKAPAPPSDG